MLRYLIVCSVVLAAGCEQYGVREATSATQDEQRANNQIAMNPARAKFQDISGNEANSLVSDAMVPAALASFQVETPAGINRKIIYQADVRVVVTDFASLESEVARIVKEQGGYLSDVAIDRTSGQQRSGRWQARIPTDRFDSFLDDVASLGVPESRNQTAQDIGEEFVDLEARITNQKRLEERVLQLLDQSDGTIKDVIAVEQELARVRGEIEKMEGRLRFLTNRTELTTVTIFAREQRDYKPPRSPRFVSRIQDAWGASLTSMRDLGANLAVGIVGAAPWLVVVGLVAVAPIGIVRKRRRGA